MTYKRYKFLPSIFLLLLISSFAGTTYAQQWQDTLREVHIQDNSPRDTATDQRSNFTAGQNKVQVDKVYKDLYESQSLANLLSQQTSVFVKSYGINSMATLSLRGASAAQSSVLWNGVPVLNPALGVADISILRTGLFSDISLQYGSSAALFGSGNVGGALLLDDEPVHFKESRKVNLNLGYGSYGRMDGSLGAMFQNKRIKVSLNGFYQYARNDFSYMDAQGLEQQLQNARLEGGGGLLAVDYNLDRKGGSHKERIYAKVWLQEYDRQIPAALFEQNAIRRQKDNSLRTLLGWEKSTRRSVWYAKGSYSKEKLFYHELTDTRNTVQQYYQEAGWKYSLSDPDRASTINAIHHQLIVFAPLQYAVATGQNISSSETQFRPAIVAAYRLNAIKNRFVINAALRQEWVNGQAAPLLPGIGGSFQLLDNKALDKKSYLQLQVRANVQRTYRIPTLNELYYFPGGNADLKPEQGWSEDGGYTLSYATGLLPEATGKKYLKTRRFTITHELNVFNRHIHDWIYWLGGAIWTPHNIAEVHSRGLETNNKVEVVAGEMIFHLGVSYAYVLSTTEASYMPGDGSIGKQIPYTPRYNVQGNAGLQWGGHFFLNYNQTYTGYRFVTTDQSQYLEPYYTGNVQASYTFTGKQKFVSLSAQVQNVFNADYQVVNGRPMPGRNFLLQLRMGLY